MPLLRFDLMEGRSEAEIGKLLDTAHNAMVAAFKVPPRDRYQIVHLHPSATTFIVQDTGLNIPRTDNVIILQVVSRKRTLDQKQTFYHLLVESLLLICGIKPSDVMVSFLENTDADWSFGYGRAQFITGEL